MIFINTKLIAANKILSEVIQRVSCPTFEYSKLDDRARIEYHELIAQCEILIVTENNHDT